MLKKILALAVFATALSAHASDNRFEMKKIEITNDPRGVGHVTAEYPVLTSHAGAGWRAINAEIAKSVESFKCDAEYGSDWDKEFISNVNIQAMNDDFTSLDVQLSYDCGGAHPNLDTYALVFDTRTGAQINMAIELGGFDFGKDWGDGDLERYEAYQRGIAHMVLPYLDPETRECISGISDDVEGQLAQLFAFGLGLTQGQVVVMGDPPHVAEVCNFKAYVPYAAARSTIIEGSVLHRWLSNR